MIIQFLTASMLFNWPVIADVRESLEWLLVGRISFLTLK